MSLDHSHNPPTPDDLIQYGKEEAVRLMTELAQKEAQGGDGRAMRMLLRLVEAAGLRGRKVRPVHDDDGA